MSLTAPDLDYRVQNFAPGFLDTPDPAALPKGGTPLAANFLFSSPRPDGQAKMRKRTGARLLNPTAIAAEQRVILYEFRREGVAAGELLAVCNGSLYKWDGGTGFTLLTALGYSAAAVVTFSTFRNLCFISDGTTQWVYDGTTVFAAGFDAPTAAPALAAAAGPGLTGTFDSLATWYDETHDTESSPSAISTAVALANQQRQHTKPAGAPPARVTHWRVYVRRTDTNEVYHKLVATVAIATATHTEQVTDSARNLATNVLAPLPNANDEPPPFAFQANADGYRFGVLTNDSYVYVSGLGAPESQHPKDKFGVARGDGQHITTVKAVGTQIIVQKGRKTFYLVGDRMPFIPKDLSPEFGNHSQDSSVSAAGRYWAWDTESGPYSTDLGGSWRNLVDGRIRTFVSTVNRSAEIRCCHVKDESLICWLVATGASTRLRTMLAYNYLVGAWLAPIYGVEYASLTTFQLADGTLHLYVGDQWGRAYQYFTDDVEGVPSGTLVASVTAGTVSTVTAAAASFYTTGDGLAGMPVAVIDTAGTWQFRTIRSNTADTITLDTINGAAWSTAPALGWTVVVGGIDWFWTTPHIDHAEPMKKKRGWQVYLEARTTSAAGATLVGRGRLDDTAAPMTVSESFALGGSGGWGSGLWGSMLWGSGSRGRVEQSLNRSYYSVQLEISNRYPNQAFEILTFGTTADWLVRL